VKISTKGRYALRMLIDLAEHQGDGFIPLKDVAERQDISKQYLEQIVTLLNTSNFLRSSRGKLGGYMLANEPAQYTIGQILRVTEGSLTPVVCLDDEINRCPKASTCKTLPIWEKFGAVITDYLDSVTLQDMLDQCADRYEI